MPRQRTWKRFPIAQGQIIGRGFDDFVDGVVRDADHAVAEREQCEGAHGGQGAHGPEMRRERRGIGDASKR
jgi:hypothetical protein